MTYPARVDGRTDVEQRTKEFLERFLYYSARPEPGFRMDESGARVSLEFVRENDEELEVSEMVDLPEAPAHEELFEWLDLAEAILEEPKPLVFVELGAGYGRWSARFGRMAAFARTPVKHLILVEAEPNHVKWANQHMVDNGFPLSSFTVIDAAVSERNGTEYFYDRMPEGTPDNTPAAWYGQALFSAVQNYASSREERTRNRFLKKGNKERPLEGWGYRSVRTVTLERVLAGTDRVSLMDFDIQNSEADVVTNSIKVLNRKVARLHIGTHSERVEQILNETLSMNNWEPVRLLPGRKCYPVDGLGDIEFVDGVQTWINPRLRTS